MVMRAGGHVAQRELLLLRELHPETHRIGRARRGHHRRHATLEEGAPPQHQMREDRLVGRAAAEMVVARKQVVRIGRATAPMADDKDRRFEIRPLGQPIVAAFVEQVEGVEHAPHQTRQPVLAAARRVDLRPARHLAEGSPVGAHQRIDRQRIEIQSEKAHRHTIFGYIPPRCRSGGARPGRIRQSPRRVPEQCRTPQGR